MADLGPWKFNDIWTFGHDFWLPPNVTWEIIQESKNSDDTRPTSEHFYYVGVVTLVMIVLRYLIVRFLIKPVGRWFLIKDRAIPRPDHNDKAENIYRDRRGNPKEDDIAAIVAATQWPERKVHRWFRQRRLADLPNKMDKFTDSGFRFMGHSSLLLLGLMVVPRKDYFSDVFGCWRNYPHRSVDQDELVYYTMEMSFYLCLTVGHFFEQRKKDFWQMLIHHFATLVLISVSFSVNYVPIGALIMLCHDIADPWLELAKLAHYTRHKSEVGKNFLKDKLTEVPFILFAALFYVTRLFIFPTFLLYSVYADSPTIHVRTWPMHYIFLTLLSTLQVLHVAWSFMIGKVIMSTILAGTVKGDSRSDDELTTDDDTLSPATSPTDERNGASLADGLRKRQNGHQHTE